MALSRYEQEVVICFNAEEETADIYTANPSWILKMDKLVKANPEQFELKEVQRYQGKIISKSYEFPKRFITIRSKDVKINLSDEEREKRAERMRKA